MGSWHDWCLHHDTMIASDVAFHVAQAPCCHCCRNRSCCCLQQKYFWRFFQWWRHFARPHQKRIVTVVVLQLAMHVLFLQQALIAVLQNLDLHHGFNELDVVKLNSPTFLHVLGEGVLSTCNGLNHRVGSSSPGCNHADNLG